MSNNILPTDFDQLDQIISGCTLCTLSEKRTNTVPGNGSRTADVMFIGEGPGYYEDQQGLPFVGRAGQLLNEMIESIGMKREDVFVTNMLKCRPPNNRDPLPIEINSCRPYLDRQIEMVAPKIIVTLGRYSTGKFIPDVPISKLHGKPSPWNGITVYPMYHPAAALRNSNLRAALERDIQRLPELLEVESPTAPVQAAPQQQQVQQLGFMDAPLAVVEPQEVDQLVAETQDEVPREPKQLGLF